MKYPYIEALKETETICIFNNWSDLPPKYTIMIPTYKRKELLQYSIESAINQESFSDYEILVLDNNPLRNDEGEQIMSNYINHPHVAYFKNAENLGIINNLNKLNLLARTEWVVMLHSDDMLYPDFMCNINNIIKTKNPSVIFTTDKIINTTDDIKPNRKINDKIILTKLKRGDYMLWNVGGNPVGMTARRKDILDLGGYNPDFGAAGDMNLHCNFTKLGQTYLLRGYPLTCYRWMDNETLKPGVLEDIIRNGSKIRRNILSEKFPILSANIISKIIKYQECKELKTLLKCSHNSNEQYNHIMLLYVIMRNYFNVLRKIRYVFAEEISHL